MPTVFVCVCVCDGCYDVLFLMQASSVPRPLSSDDAPCVGLYHTQKWCTLCKIKVGGGRGGRGGGRRRREWRGDSW